MYDGDIYITIDGKLLDEVAGAHKYDSLLIILRHFGIDAEIEHNIYDGPDFSEEESRGDN